ncbi:phosphoglycerate dehydrogenase-like enzyme [Endobacter medicaginis]|uniref:Phosphoglycerate dehydrogenase-like enzyme n=3 Tax=Endobacter medicaginis TaxID=1181271 RepID=A0A839UX00_9PROT|nr:NAD(P)-dependent oxidoreductase [Endobacter medicaginis]MBB3172903.1 phosphoglycerate dehydrogenase-like enzyme [Endobacter medicaginis]MCX5474828.1 NAD(P)-binding domain-containing protein [Endobacter medicaginis]
MARRETLVVVNQLGEAVRDALAPFGSRLQIVEADRDSDTPWQYANLARAADVLLTGPSPGWKNAPVLAPPGWAAHDEGPEWVQLASAGIDGYPHWLLAGRTVTCGRGDAAVPIAEHVLAALLLHTRRLDRLGVHGRDAWIAQGTPFRLGTQTLPTLSGRTLGIAGFGAIGRAVAQRARAFGVEMLAWRRRDWAPGEAAAEAVRPVASLAELAASSDDLLLALPLTAATRGIVDGAVLGAARPGLHLINVARGALIDETALLTALASGRVGAATLDVTEPEPLPDGHPFYAHPSIRLTPHVSWSGPEVRASFATRVADNLDRFLSGRPLRDLVDAAAGY